MAGAGVQAPYSHGATDPFGYQATEKVVTTHDFHATSSPGWIGSQKIERLS